MKLDDGRLLANPPTLASCAVWPVDNGEKSAFNMDRRLNVQHIGARPHN